MYRLHTTIDWNNSIDIDELLRFIAVSKRCLLDVRLNDLNVRLVLFENNDVISKSVKYGIMPQ